MNAIRQHAAAEVLELGEMLFDIAIEAASRESAEGEESDVLLVEELRVAAGEFFMALRLLLEADNDFSHNNSDIGISTSGR